MEVTFLGTNGFFTAPTGYTTSILVETSQDYIILDAGTGMGRVPDLLEEDKPISLFLSHFHLDHLMGLSVIEAMKNKTIHLYGEEGMEKALDKLFSKPLYPFPLEEFPPEVKLHELKPGEHSLSGFKLECAFLHHWDPVYGYRVEAEDKALAYCTDTAPCENAVRLARKADLLIHECNQPTGREHDFHSTPEQAALTAKKAEAERLALMHFNTVLFPSQEDREEAGREARKIFPNTVAAKDLMTFSL